MLDSMQVEKKSTMESGNIPKIIHLTWKHKKILESKSKLVLFGIRNLVDLNPDWKVIIYDDRDIDNYLKEMLSISDYNLVKDIHIVAKSDIWRLIKLYYQGGLYIDIDRFCNIKLSDIIGETTMWVLPTYKDSDFSHDFMLSAPNNPAFYNAYELYFQRRREGHNNIYFLGPQTYMHAITNTLCGQIINTNPGIEVFNQIRSIITQIPFIKTYREEPPNNTIIYRSNNSYDLETLKRDFYAEEGIKHWTGDW